jgi:hypothetical protein
VPAKGKLVYEITQAELLASLEKDVCSISRPFEAPRRVTNDALYNTSVFYKGTSDALIKMSRRRKGPKFGGITGCQGPTRSAVPFSRRAFDPRGDGNFFPWPASTAVQQ